MNVAFPKLGRAPPKSKHALPRRIIPTQQATGGANMAKTKQFTISIANRPGTVAEIARALGSAKVNILALLGTAQGTTGTVELVVEDARRAKKALDAA